MRALMIPAAFAATVSLVLVPMEASLATAEASLEQQLGELLYSDQDLSLNRNQSCENCHSLEPEFGFVDPENVTDLSPVSGGSSDGAFGSLNAPSAGYAAFSPFFHWNSDEGLYVGGQFWNGRAATLAEQAAGPFLNPVEMAMPSAWAVVTRVKEKRRYVRLFKWVYDMNLDLIPAYELADDRRPPPGVLAAYDRLTRAIAAFEQSRRFNQFSSKFDFVLAGMTTFSEQEARGLALFNGDAQCSACHVSDPGVAANGGLLPPMFTDFTYDNLGLPRNVNIPGNPDPDLGLGGRADIAAVDPEGGQVGKHKVMSLRNIALSAPYGHNGVFTSLGQMVHFYNTRDTLGWVADNNSAGFGVSGWPDPEIAETVNTDELGDLGLSEQQEQDLVAFLATLSDGYPESGGDPRVPPGTPSPFAHTPLPPSP